MKLYRVIKVDKSSKNANKDAQPTMEIRHKVKVVKPWKMLRKLWTSWL